MFYGVGHGLGDKEIRRRLDPLRMAAFSLGDNGRRNRCAIGQRPDCGRQSRLSQQWRLETSSEAAQLTEPSLDLARRRLDLLATVAGGAVAGIGYAQRKQCVDETLLGPVVQVSLDAPPLEVLGRDEARTRLAQLLHKSKATQHETSLRSKVMEQPALDRGQLLTSRFHDHERAERLAVVKYRLQIGMTVVQLRHFFDACQRGTRSVAGGRRGGEPQPVTHLHPDLGRRGSGAFSQKLGHAWQQDVRLFGPPDAAGKVGEHVVRPGTLAVNRGIGDRLKA